MTRSYLYSQLEADRAYSNASATLVATAAAMAAKGSDKTCLAANSTACYGCKIDMLVLVMSSMRDDRPNWYLGMCN